MWNQNIFFGDQLKESYKFGFQKLLKAFKKLLIIFSKTKRSVIF